MAVATIPMTRTAVERPRVRAEVRRPVLYLDASEHWQGIVRRAAKAKGYGIISAYNLGQALELARGVQHTDARQYAAYIADKRFPETRGFGSMRTCLDFHEALADYGGVNFAVFCSFGESTADRELSERLQQLVEEQEIAFISKQDIEGLRRYFDSLRAQ